MVSWIYIYFQTHQVVHMWRKSKVREEVLPKYGARKDKVGGHGK